MRAGKGRIERGINQPLTENGDVELHAGTPKVKEGCFTNSNDVDFYL